MQLVLACTYFSEDAFSFALSLTSHLSLLPHVLSALYLLQIVFFAKTRAQTHDAAKKESIIGVLATAYTAFLVFAGGLKFLLLGFLIYAPGSLLFVKTRRENGQSVFSTRERLALLVVVLGAVGAAYGLATRRIAF